MYGNTAVFIASTVLSVLDVAFIYFFVPEVCLILLPPSSSPLLPLPPSLLLSLPLLQPTF
jgi:hypothetical protein